MKFLFCCSIFIWAVSSNAQNSSYQNDLAALKAILEKTPSYKAQIRGSKRTDYERLYHQLAADTGYDLDEYEYFYNLAQLVFPLRDNHIGFYQLPASQNPKSSAPSVVTWIDINTDSLKTELAGKPADSIEGIYHYGKYYSVGLFRSGSNEYTGVVVDSELPSWNKGVIVMHLYPFGPNQYKAIYHHPRFRNLIFQPNEKYINQSLINSFFYSSYSNDIYSKSLTGVDHVSLSPNSPLFALKNINNDVQYLLIRTFQVNTATRQQSDRFYDSIRNQLTAPNLILDLRNNQGGARKEMKKYYHLIKRYSKKGQVYVLLNNGTLSQAEIFTLKLRKLRNLTTLGQTTAGMLTYGSNYGRRQKLPSQRFEVYATDMKGRAGRLKYEGIGIKPDVVLDSQADWIEQVLAIIRSDFF